MDNWRCIIISYRQLLVIFIVISTLSFVGGCQNKKNEPFRVGILSGIKAFETVGEEFVQKMEELGYHAGKNIVYDFQKLNSNTEKETEAAEKFVADKVDLIVAFPSGTACTAQQVAGGFDIPIVFTWAAIDGTDLAQSIREPSRNITGVIYPPKSDFFVKRFEILNAMVPHAKRILMFHNPNYPTCVSTLGVLQKVAPSMGIELVVVPIRSREDFIAELNGGLTDANGGIDAIFPMPDPITLAPKAFEILSSYAAQNRIPLGGSAEFTLRLGALYCYAPSFSEAGHLAAPFADKILKGAQPSSLPLVTLEAQLHINLKRAEELGLTVPEGLLKQAVEIIR
jgi:putative tryptophan/tyrosine transport system substrate-binding protein